MRRDRDALDRASRARQNKALPDLDTVSRGERQEFRRRYRGAHPNPTCHRGNGGTSRDCAGRLERMSGWIALSGAPSPR